MTGNPDDPLDRLGRTPGDDARFLETLPTQVSAALAEERAVEVEVDEDGSAWLLRTGERVTRFDPAAMASLSPADADRAIAGFAELVRRFDRERAFLRELSPGRHVRVDHKNVAIRRTFRTRGTVRSVSAFRPGSGIRPGGWTLEIEVRPRFGKPSVQPIESATIADVRPL